MKKERTLIIGDIHGGFRGMIQALDRAGFNPKEDTLISLGDIADGWSETPQCVEYLMSVKNLISIRGNHDKWTQNWFDTGVAEIHWVMQGGQATKHAYEQARMNYDFDIESHANFFRKQINFYIDDNNRAFVHGGFMSEFGLENNVESVYYWDRSLWKLAMTGHHSQYIPKSLRSYSDIFIGHTSTINIPIKPNFPEYNDVNQSKSGSITVPMKRCNVWNLDTGGGWGGKITVMDVDTKEYWQSDLLGDLYKGESGRYSPLYRM